MSFAKLNKVGLRSRLIILFVLLFGGMFIAFSAILYDEIRANHEKEFDAALYNYAVDVARAVEVDLFGDITLGQNIFSDSEKVFPFALGETYIQLHSTANGRLVAKSSSLGRSYLPFHPEDFDGSERKLAIFRTLNATESRALGIRNGTYRLLDFYIDKMGPWDFVLQIAVPMRLLEKEQKNLFAFFLVGIPIMLLLAACGGWYLSAKALAPVNAIISTTKNLTARKLSERVPVPESADEIRELVETLNALFDRLEQAFKSQETFISDASHQLKTPLAILRGEIDLMLSKQRSPEETQEFLHSTSQEVNYLGRIVEDLLVLARMEGGRNVLTWQNVRMDELLLEVSARLESAAAAKKIKFNIHLQEGSGDESAAGCFETRGDPDLLRCLVENLVNNAVKYSPEESSITLELYNKESSIELLVKDQGPGVPEADAQKIFDRFFRADSSKIKVAGSGLGLPIAKKIADFHGARISLQSALGGGALFSVLFPKANSV